MTPTEAATVTVVPAGHPTPVVLGHSAIDALPWQPRPGLGEVRVKELLRSGDCLAGLLRLEPGAGERAHSHSGAHHHVWVLQGEAQVAGIRVHPGAYIHVPAGVEHAITDAGPQGCEVFYVYQPEYPVTRPRHWTEALAGPRR